jgi:molybdenum cofactor guanylyltransferase
MSDGALPSATAIVLAGGRSSRFGRNKLAEPVAGRPLLDHAILAVAAVAREVLVVVPPIGEAPRLPRSPDPAVPIAAIRDPEPFGGPLVAVLAGLERAREPFALIVGGDMPKLSPDVLAAVLRVLDASDAEGVFLVFRGRRQPLPVGLRVGAATAATRRLLADGVRSLQSLADALRIRELSEGEWRPLDPVAGTLHDVDAPGDLPT